MSSAVKNTVKKPKKRQSAGSGKRTRTENLTTRDLRMFLVHLKTTGCARTAAEWVKKPLNAFQQRKGRMKVFRGAWEDAMESHLVAEGLFFEALAEDGMPVLACAAAGMMDHWLEQRMKDPPFRQQTQYVRRTFFRKHQQSILRGELSPGQARAVQTMLDRVGKPGKL